MTTLLELSAEEAAFLTPLPALSEAMAARLTRRLGLTLAARLRSRVQAHQQAAPIPVETPTAPRWQPDAALANVWLTRRLGGQNPTGTSPFVPSSLLHALDGILAECWLDDIPADTPPSLAWRLEIGVTQASVRLDLPHDPSHMTRWAQDVIRHD